MRPNSPPQIISVSSSMPRCFRSLISAADPWSTSFGGDCRSILDAAVMIPAAMIELDEPHTAFGQATGQQAVRREGAVAALGPVQIQNVLRFVRQIHQLGHRRLHAEGQFVLRDARFDLGIAESLDCQPVQRLATRRMTSRLFAQI